MTDNEYIAEIYIDVAIEIGDIDSLNWSFEDLVHDMAGAPQELIDNYKLPSSSFKKLLSLDILKVKEFSDAMYEDDEHFIRELKILNEKVLDILYMFSDLGFYDVADLFFQKVDLGMVSFDLIVNLESYFKEDFDREYIEEKLKDIYEQLIHNSDGQLSIMRNLSLFKENVSHTSDEEKRQLVSTLFSKKKLIDASYYHFFAHPDLFSGEDIQERFLQYEKSEVRGSGGIQSFFENYKKISSPVDYRLIMDTLMEGGSTREVAVYGLPILQEYNMGLPSQGLTLENIEEVLQGVQDYNVRSFTSISSLTKNYPYDSYLRPIIKSQGPSAFLYLEDVERLESELSNQKRARDQGGGMSLSDMKVVTGIAKRYGTLARNILEEIVVLGVEKGSIEIIADEEKFIHEYIAFWEGVLIVHNEIYNEFKQYFIDGDTKNLEELKSTMKALQENIINGSISDKDLENKYFHAVAYVIFPPGIGITAEQTTELNRKRPDNQYHIDAWEAAHPELKDVVNAPFSLSTGSYELAGGEKLDLEEWNNIQKAVKKVNTEVEKRAEKGKEEKKVDLLEAAKRIVRIYLQKGIGNPSEKQWLTEEMYRLYRQTENGELPSTFMPTQEGLMQYKIFIGDRVKNDLIDLCLNEL